MHQCLGMYLNLEATTYIFLKKTYSLFLTGTVLGAAVQHMISEASKIAAASSIDTETRQVGEADKTRFLLGVQSLYFIHAISEME